MSRRRKFPVIFQERVVPDGTKMAGWIALMRLFDLRVPVRHPSSVSEQNISTGSRQQGEWQVYGERYQPENTFAGHLTFALRYEGLDLLVLKRIFEATPKREVEAYVRDAPAGIYSRRAWYLYEFLTGRTLDIPDSQVAASIDLLDPELYFTARPRLSRRHRVRDNLLGVPGFCPVIRRTPALNEFAALNLMARAQETVGQTGPHLIARAASFLLLADSRASFNIEGERAPRTRLERWGRAVMQSGRAPLTLEEILRLHRVLIEDNRFVQPGLRRNGIFLGRRDPDGDPLPEFVGAKPADLASLMQDLLSANTRMRDESVDPVLEAAATAFGFVFIHPFEDGNGRMHRCLIHHVLAERKFTPPGMIFPVSTVMLDRIDDYRASLQSHSEPLMPFIEWKPTPERNVDVTGETADMYRYFDCTAQAEFLYSCVRRTVEHDLPHEIDYLKRNDQATRRIMEAVEMPDRMADNIVMYIRANNGILAKSRREGEFGKLRAKEVATIEKIVNDAFDGFL